MDSYFVIRYLGNAIKVRIHRLTESRMVPGRDSQLTKQNVPKHRMYRIYLAEYKCNLGKIE